MKNKLTFENYSLYLNRLIPSKYQTQLDYDRVKTSYEGEFKLITNFLNNEEYAKKYHKNIPVDGSLPHDYLAKLLKYNDIEFVTSIRFFNRNPGKPFAYVEYYSCDTKNFFNNWIEIRKIILKEYAVFKLNKIRLSLKIEDKSCFEQFKPERDLGMYTAPLNDILKTEFNSNQQLRIEKIDHMSTEDYAVYLTEYDSFKLANPHLTSIIAEPLETINEHCQNGYGFKLYFNNEWAGFALFANYSEYFLYGYLVWDKLIFEKFRGQNLSVYLQNQGFKEYVKDTTGFIYGTIETNNHGSIKTAEKSGREFIFGSYFFE